MMVILFPIIYLGWKFVKGTNFRKPEDVDLYQDVEEIEEYTRNYVEKPEKNRFFRWFNKLFS
jgi:amino acid transporter